MEIVWLYARRPVVGYQQLLHAYSDREFDSPCRSTVPLLMCWRDAEKRARELSKTLGFRLSNRVYLDFEYPVRVQRGKGRASCTDLMMNSGNTSLAIEAKWTEPRYETVSEWLGKGSNPKNRQEVLEVWIDLLGQGSSKKPKVVDMLELPYQLVHRAASACFPDSKNRWLVYQLFDMMSHEYEMYLRDLGNFAGVLGSGRSLKICVASYRIERTERQVELECRWTNSGERHLHEPVRTGLGNGDLLSVHQEQVVIL